MTIIQTTQAIWLHGPELCPIEHLAEISGLSIEEIEDLVQSGVIAPADLAAQPQVFELRHVVTVRTARRLRDDFQLDHRGVALALTLLKRIELLEAELEAARAEVRTGAERHGPA